MHVWISHAGSGWDKTGAVLGQAVYCAWHRENTKHDEVEFRLTDASYLYIQTVRNVHDNGV